MMALLFGKRTLKAFFILGSDIWEQLLLHPHLTLADIVYYTKVHVSEANQNSPIHTLLAPSQNFDASLTSSAF